MNSCWRAKLGDCSNFFLFDPLHQLFALFPHADYINLPFFLCGFFLGWTKDNRKNQNGEEGETRYLNFSPSLPFWYISCCSGDPLTNSHTGCPPPTNPKPALEAQACYVERPHWDIPMPPTPGFISHHNPGKRQGN